MRGDFTLPRDSNRLREQQAARIAILANPLRNPRAPRDPRRIERILQQQRGTELFISQLSNQSFSASNSRLLAGPVVAEYLQRNALPTIDVRHIRQSQNRNPHHGKSPAYRA